MRGITTESWQLSAYRITGDKSGSINSGNSAEAIIAKMNVLLQKHGAKHIYKVPEGLRELCADIAREVLRSQPRNIYCFVADYVEALLITRENAKVAMKVVNNILLDSQAIVAILYRSGLSLEQIARAASKIQKAFRAYLDAIDMRAAQVREGDAICACDKESEVSLQDILRAMGVSLEQAQDAATIIQAAFRGHYRRMLLNESQGVIQWQRAAVRTLEILRKAGASQAEASKAAILIQATYRGYYTRRSLKMKMTAKHPQEEKGADLTESRETIQAVAWLDMMYEESGLTPTRANEAASIIQRAYKRYRARKNTRDVPQAKLSQTMVVEAIVKSLHEKVFNDIVSRADVPVEFGDRASLMQAGEELQRAFRNRLTRARIAEEDTGYDREKELARLKELDVSFSKLTDDGMYSSGMAEDREEDREKGREIEVGPEDDGGTDAHVRH